MPLLEKKPRISMRVGVVSIFAIASMLTAILAISLQYHFGHVLAKEAASDLYASAASGAAAELRASAIPPEGTLLLDDPRRRSGLASVV